MGKEAYFRPALDYREQGQISHYVAGQTGGEYFSAPAQGYAAALEKILMQLHFAMNSGLFLP